MKMCFLNDASMVSNALKQMLLERKGYRCESYGGSGIRNFREVITFEIEELGNIDILSTMKILYGDFEVNFEENNVDVVIDKVCSYTSAKMGRPEKDLSAIWLSTKADVESNYVEDDVCDLDSELESYSIGECNMIVSDLGNEGVLFVY